MKYQAIDGDYIREMKEYDEFLKEKAMMYKGMKYGYFIFIFIVILSALFSGNLVLAQTPNDLSYDFQNDNLYNATNIEYADSFNIRNQSEYTGHYNATYSFENDTINSVPEDFTSATASTVIESWEGHDNVLEIVGTTGTIDQLFTTPQDHGTVEFYMGSNDATDNTDFFLKNTASHNVIFLYITGDKIKYWSGTAHDICNAVDNKLYHIRIDFECSGNGYLGLAQYTFFITIDSVKYGAYSFTENENEVDRITLLCNAGSSYYGIFDAIGYSWDVPYTGINFNVSGEMTLASGIVFDGTYFWIANESEIFRYTSAGVYDSFHFDVSSQDNGVLGLTYDGNYLWFVGYESQEVYKYDTLGVYQSVYFDADITGEEAVGITFDGNYFWIVGIHNIFQFTYAGVYTGVYFSVQSESGNPIDIMWDETYLWVLDSGTPTIFQYTYEGNYTGISIDVSDLGNDMMGITFDDIYIWIVDYSNLGVYRCIYKEYYYIGGNLFPYLNVSKTVKEVDKWEFSTKENGDFTEYEAIVPFWDEINGSEYLQNGYIRLFSSSIYDMGIYKDDFNVSNEVLNVTFTLEYEYMKVQDGVFYCEIYSQDSTLIIQLRFHSWGVASTKQTMMSYYDGADFINVSLIEEHIDYTFNLYYHSNLVFLRYNTSKVLFFPTLASKPGLSEVKFVGNAGENGDAEGEKYYFIKLKSIGVYVNGISLSNDYYRFNFSLNEDWDSNEYNLFKYDIIGNYSIVANNFVLLSFGVHLEGDLINVWDLFTGDIEEAGDELVDCEISITSNVSIEFNSFSIDGVMLVEGVNEYIPDFTYSQVNISESYFYVVGDVLYFTLTSNDSFLEYMELSFDVDNVYSGNRSLSWSGRKSGTTLNAQFEVNYLDSTYNPFVLESDYKSLTSMLPKSKMIDSFDLLITDDDSDLNDTITGFLGSFVLLYNPLLTTDFVSLELLDMLPVVVLVVVIPLALYVGFGRKKELLVPAILGMSIFGTVIGLIPFWLTFVIGFACVSYYLIQRGS